MNSLIKDIEQVIKSRRIDLIVSLFFNEEEKSIKPGYKTENELWDYKEHCPGTSRSSSSEWADIAKDVIAFHNNKGGIIIFGVCDKSFSLNKIKEEIDSKLFNDKIRKWVGDSVWVDYHRELISENQTYIGIALIPPRGPKLAIFVKDSPSKNGKYVFKRNQSAIRENDSSKILKDAELLKFSQSINQNPINNVYAIDEENYRVLAPEYKRFVERSILCSEIQEGLKDRRSSVVSLVGIGGVGKTALATWAVINSYYAKDFDFIVSITAKDRELTRYGIAALEAKLTSYESLLDNIVEVMKFDEVKNYKIDDKEKFVNEILEDSNTLLFIDNLETVDDKRIIDFINHLPTGVRAIVTSRRQRIRFSAYPIEIKPLSDKETISFIKAISLENGYSYLSNLSDTEKISVGKSCDGIPLAIRWLISSNRSIQELDKSAKELQLLGRKGEELLEFSFRRVFERMSNTEKSIIKVLSVFNSPVILETITIGTKLSMHEIADTIEVLVDDTIVYKYFSEEYNDSSYTVLPITRNFILNKILDSKEQSTIRTRLNDWFQGKDIHNATERAIIQKVRQGREKPEHSLLELANLAIRDGDMNSAEDYFNQAISRNPRSYEALRRFAEFYRHQKNNISRALSLYEQAAKFSPTRGSQRALIFREWGMLLKGSGEVDSLDKAIDKLNICLLETPNDNYASVTVATLYKRKGMYRKIPELLEKFLDHDNPQTREIVHGLLIEAYEYQNDFIKAAELKNKTI